MSEIQPTNPLYYENPYIKEFDAKVLQITKVDNRFGIVLNQTAFYPTGGGQPADTGTIKGLNGEAKIEDAQTSKGVITHITNQIIGKIEQGENVRGVIDWNRRFTLMRNHTTAHLMAEAIRRATGISMEIVGSGLDVDKVRLDLAHEGSLGPQLSEIERVANAVVKENRPVEIKTMPRTEAERYVAKFYESLKTLPPQVQNVRIVEVKDWHACACGGTHIKSTGEIGAVKVLRRMSKGKGVERIEFVAV